MGGTGVHRAIEVYQRSNMFAEAISLANLRLSPSDPVIQNLYLSWAAKCQEKDLHDQAARCYIAAHHHQEAIREILRKNDQVTFETALEIARLAGDATSLKTINRRV
eukprot:TRINITY_DN7618_c0_g1_i1.p1 TRINITY_DN7618_c0_g1~~TRINITY_DN7618_c0_g1_i1.p1  ORF type:complete len:118 (+),score=18.60 TRINITY_DN7618_c0_g1_i1:34-354(+)